MFFTPLVMYVFCVRCEGFFVFQGVKNKLEMRNEKLFFPRGKKLEIRNDKWRGSNEIRL